MGRLSELLRGGAGLKGTEVLRAIMPPAVEYVRGLEERASRLEIEPDPKDVEEYRAITDGAWPSYVRGTRKG